MPLFVVDDHGQLTSLLPIASFTVTIRPFGRLSSIIIDQDFSIQKSTSQRRDKDRSIHTGPKYSGR